MGNLIVGIEESRDGRNRASAIVHVEGVADIKRWAEDVLGSGMSPPLTERSVTPLSVEGKDVLIIAVSGRRGYPIEVEDKQEANRFVIREAGKKSWLSSEEARLRRRALERAPLRFAIVAITGLVVGVLFLGLRMVALEADVVAVQASLGPREVRAQRAEQVAALLTPPAPVVVEVSSLFGVHDGESLAADLATVLRRAGWKVIEEDPSLSSPAPKGVAINRVLKNG